MRNLIYFLINKHQDFVRGIVVIAALLLIIIWFPEGGQFKYQYTEGKPWRYNDLIAPFDFAIQKSEEEVNKEKKQILENFKPYYRVDTALFKQKKQNFKKEFRQRYSQLGQQQQSTTQEQKKTFTQIEDTSRYIKLGVDLLHHIYQKGVIHLAEPHRSFETSKQINVLKNNVAEKKKVSSFYTRESAIQWLQDTVKGYDYSYFLTPLLVSAVQANVKYDKSTTEQLKEKALENISTTRGMIQEGEIIINKGSIVTDEKYQILQSLEQKYEETIGGPQKYYTVRGGYFALICLALGVLMIYLYLFRSEIFFNVRKLMFILFIIVAIVTFTGWMLELGVPSIYIIPFCIIPILTRAFFDVQTAVYTLISGVLITSLIVPNSFTFALLNIFAGMMAIFSNVHLHYRSHFFISSIIILFTYFLSYTGIVLVQEADWHMIEWSNYGWLTINVLLTLLAYPLLPFFEKLFGLMSEVTLFELSDLNKPLLKQLSVKAPGTFQHTLQVANLAEEAADQVGGDPLLTRVGALYHDIGKMDKPMYFIENQSRTVNPHDELDFEESAKIIIAHVHKGVEMAKHYNLPEIIIDFVRTHHGTSRVEYFYQSYLKNYPKEFVDESKFRYPGPIPFSKETGILMLADSVEAASRSLKDPEESDIDSLVDNIVRHKIDQDQFINADLTFKDITTIKKLFKKRLKSIHHVRISYPEAS